jgi:hypothetical protein
MSNVPLARKLLAEMKPHLPAKLSRQVDGVIGLLKRRPYARPASPIKSKVVDEELAKRIRRFALRYPDMSQQDIAVRFRTNAGRVSEALHGDR